MGVGELGEVEKLHRAMQRNCICLRRGAAAAWGDGEKTDQRRATTDGMASANGVPALIPPGFRGAAMVLLQRR